MQDRSEAVTDVLSGLCVQTVDQVDNCSSEEVGAGGLEGTFDAAGVGIERVAGDEVDEVGGFEGERLDVRREGGGVDLDVHAEDLCPTQAMQQSTRVSLGVVAKMPGPR